MERRIYFVMGDLLCNAAGGALAGVVVALAAGSWPPLPGMAAGMLLGGAAAMLIAPLGGLLFGMLELMLPMMVSGMAAGMLAAMWASAGTLQAGAAAARGALVGLLVLAATYLLNAYLQRRGSKWTN